MSESAGCTDVDSSSPVYDVSLLLFSSSLRRVCLCISAGFFFIPVRVVVGFLRSVCVEDVRERVRMLLFYGSFNFPQRCFVSLKVLLPLTTIYSTSKQARNLIIYLSVTNSTNSNH